MINFSENGRFQAFRDAFYRIEKLICLICGGKSRGAYPYRTLIYGAQPLVSVGGTMQACAHRDAQLVELLGHLNAAVAADVEG